VPTGPSGEAAPLVVDELSSFLQSVSAKHPTQIRTMTANRVDMFASTTMNGAPKWLG
jgi:hypothetical protein